jgi:hypothetical protein
LRGGGALDRGRRTSFSVRGSLKSVPPQIRTFQATDLNFGTPHALERFVELFAWPTAATFALA